MVSQAILIAMAVGVFFAGLGIGYAVFQSYNQPNYEMMTPQQMQQMMNNPQVLSKWMNTMMSNPQTMNQWMSSMMSNPQTMNQWMGSMMQNPQIMQSMMSNPQFNQQWTGMMMNNPNMMNQWMGTVMSNPDFQQKYMGPYMMMRDPQFMQNMRNQYAQNTNLESLAIAADKVSILANTWQYQSTEAYSPAVIKVSAGTIVTWTNDDKIIHTVTDLGNGFDSGFIQPNETWKHTFDAKGNYYYFCSIHPWMKGAVIVS